MLIGIMVHSCFCFNVLFSRATSSLPSTDKSWLADQGTSLDLVKDEGGALQDTLWVETFGERLRSAKALDVILYQQLSTNATFESSLQLLTKQYNEHGFTKRLPQVTAVLIGLQPFTSTLGTMVQSHPEVAALVWGSVQFLLQVRCTLDV